MPNHSQPFRTINVAVVHPTINVAARYQLKIACILTRFFVAVCHFQFLLSRSFLDYTLSDFAPSCFWSFCPCLILFFFIHTYL